MKIIFTKHAEQRALERKIDKQEVIDCLQNNNSAKINNYKFCCKIKSHHGIIEVIFEKKESHIIVITVYWV